MVKKRRRLHGTLPGFIIAQGRALAKCKGTPCREAVELAFGQAEGGYYNLSDLKKHCVTRMGSPSKIDGCLDGIEGFDSQLKALPAALAGRERHR